MAAMLSGRSMLRVCMDRQKDYVGDEFGYVRDCLCAWLLGLLIGAHRGTRLADYLASQSLR